MKATFIQIDAGGTRMLHGREKFAKTRNTARASRVISTFGRSAAQA
jgi:hypothetical protein